MRSIFLSILIGFVFLCAATVGGMTLVGMTHQMDVEMDSTPETVICLDHCLQAFAPETVVPTTLALLWIVAIGFLGSVFPIAAERLAHHFQRWRETIATFLRHQQLSTIVLRD